MNEKILNGKEIAANLQCKLYKEITDRIKNNIPEPCLAVILIGNDPASKIYVNNKKHACKAVGIKSLSFNLPTATSTKDLIKLINELNNNENVNGILVQLPLPKHIDQNLILEQIKPEKDVDGFHPYNLGRLAQKNPLLRPCTPYGIMQILETTNEITTGMNATVIGASNIVGRPMALELLLANSTVTICHAFTKNLPEKIYNADLVVVAVGKPKLIKAEWLKENSIVIDVGINRMKNGKIVGDVEFEEALSKVKYITPVPGGVGPMTITALLQNTLAAQKMQLI